MSFTTTYTELLAEVQAIMEDDGTEFVAEIPNIINQSELRVLRDIDLDIFKTTEDVTLDGTTLSIPSGAVMVYSIRDTVNSKTLERRSSEYVQMYGGTGNALYFAEESDTTLRVAPAPTSGTAAKARVLKRPTALSGSNETNWLTDNVGDLLLAACLVYSARFLKMGERIAELETGYNVLLAQSMRELKPLANADYERASAASHAEA